MIRRKLIYPFLFVLIPGLYLITWILHVGPLADKDAILQIYFPLLNYLKGAQLVGLDHAFLVSEFFSDAYPDGIALFGWLISFLGLESFFLEEPYLFLIFLVLPCLIAIKPWSLNGKKVFLILIVFSLPATQIAMKGFSPHGFNVLYSFAGMISYLNFQRSKALSWFIFALLLFWLSMSFKHMGILHHLSFLFAHLLWQLGGEKKSTWENFLLWVLPLTVLPMYPVEKSYEYVKTTFSHAPPISLTSLTFLVIVAIGIILSFKKFSRRVRERRNSASKFRGQFRGFGSILAVYAIVLIPFWLWTYPSSEKFSLWFGVAILVFGYALSLMVLLMFDNQTIRGFMVILALVTTTHHTALYVSWIAKSSYLFFLPQLLITWLWFLHGPTKIVYHLLLIFLVILSNFFPALHFLEGHKKLNNYSSIYFEGFKSIHQNPLGWQSSKVLEIRGKIADVLSSANLQDGSIALAPDLHFHSRLSLVFPKNILFNFGQVRYLDELDSVQTLEWLERWRWNQSDFVHDLLINGQIPILILGQDPFTQRTVEQVTSDEAQAQAEFLPNRFLQAISDAYMHFLRANNYLGKYYNKVLEMNQYGLQIWVHQVAQERGQVTPAWERWRRGIDLEVDEADIKQQEITRIFIESNSYFDSDPQKCLELLNKVLEMDPDHESAKEDRALIMERLKLQAP